MSRTISLNLIALSVEKNIQFQVQDTATLDEISEELVKLYRNCDKSSFKYKKQSQQLPLSGKIKISELVQPSKDELTLYVECITKKSDVCCIIY